MEILYIGIGLVVGAIIGYLVGNTLLAKVNKQREADLDKKRERY